MKTYQYKGFARDGSSCKGLVEAFSLKAARERLAQDGILAERVALTGQMLQIPRSARALLYRELGELLRAGLPLERALEILIDSPELKDSHLLFAGIRDRVREGSSLADALSDSSSSVTEFERALVEAAERSAAVEIMLDRLADFLEQQERLKDRVQSALLYPAMVVTFGICVAIVMMGVLIPRVRDMLESGRTELPGLTRFMMGMGDTLMTWGVPAAVLIGVAVVLLRLRLKKDEVFRRDWDRMLFKVPLLGKGYTLLVNLRFARTMAILINGGISVIDSMILAGRATGSVWVAHLAESGAEAVRHGTALSAAVRKIPPLAATLPGRLQVGEASGSLGRLLESAGERYRLHWERFTERCLSLLEPILILLIGGFVLLVTLSILLPVMSLGQAVGG
jgi:general secretion pathway protein F